MTKFIFLTLLISLFEKFLFLNFNYIEYLDIIFEAVNAFIYLDDKYEIFGNDEDEDCFEDIYYFINDFQKFINKYPKLIISNGKGVDDIGNEIECTETNLFAEYLLVYIETEDNIIKTDKGLSNYLDRNFLYLGFCLPKNCLNLTKRIFDNMNKTSISIFNKYKIKDIKIFSNKDIEKKVTSTIIFYFFIICLGIKLLAGILIKFFFPKGYEYYGIFLYNRKRQLESKINEDEIDEDLLKNKVNEENDNKKLEYINIRGRYNPEFDYEDLYPMYFRFIKFLDLFNNIKIYMLKRNRYFNDNDIDILCSLKAIILGYHILTTTIQVLIRLPNTNVFNTGYYNHLGLFIYKRSINSFTFWIILESATFSFKLMKFIQKKINKIGEGNINKRKHFNIVVSQTFKFFCFYIPKIIAYIFVFIFFYYLFDHYTYDFEAKMTHHYISKEIVNKKLCNTKENLWHIFIPFLNYKINLAYEKNNTLNISSSIPLNNENANYSSTNGNMKRIISVCFPFVYIYSNMFFSSLVFIIILFILFYFQKKGIDITISLLNFVGAIISYIYYYSNNPFYINKDGKYQYKFFHFSGEYYCIFYPHVFFGYYYLGCILGFCLYHYNEQKSINKENQNIKKKKSFQKLKNISKSADKKEDNNNVIKLYKPMEFCSSFIIYLKNTKNYIKILFLFIYFILIIFLSFIFFIFLNIYNKSEYSIYIENHHILKFLFFFEKIINSYLFFFFICILIVLPRDSTLIKIMTSSFFIPISRAGFFVTCTYESLIYILYSLFQLKVKLGFLVICYIMLGFYTIIAIFCIYASILIEFPFRVIIKNLLKDESANKQNLKMLLMKQI